jgi:post-segregation antitoxin (ccd killing protein)
MGKPLKYNKVKVLKISESQHNSLKKLRAYKVNVADFIRLAIKEKLKRDYPKIIQDYNDSQINMPF